MDSNFFSKPICENINVIKQQSPKLQNIKTEILSLTNALTSYILYYIILYYIILYYIILYYMHVYSGPI